MNLIASGAYLQGEFPSEVGFLPPSFLSIGNKRLYEYQVDFLRLCSITFDEDIYLSIPQSFDLDCFDKKRLDNLNVKLLRVPDGMSLGESLLYCWNSSGKHHKTLTLLHGDTLFLDTHFDSLNTVSVHKNKGFYKRAVLGQDKDSLRKVHDDWSSESDKVISGFFRFSDPLYFMKSLVERKSDFIQAIVGYHQKFPVILDSKGEWLDFGHINSFYQSRTRMTTERSFNDLKINYRSVIKSSKSKSKKIYAEGNWFFELPLSLRIYTPALLEISKGNQNFIEARYSLEYLYLLPLNDLFVFCRLDESSWDLIFKGLFHMLSDFSNFKLKKVTDSHLAQFNDLYLKKTIKRLESFSNQSSYSLSNNNFKIGSDIYSLRDIAEISAGFISPVSKKDISIIHGDLCFSNILFDNRVGSIKCIDPRGMSPSGELSIYGDKRYDIAKVYHSVFGLYDLIIANRYEMRDSLMGTDISFSINEEFHSKLLDNFRKTVLFPLGYNEKEILAITIHLFLSMIPLHDDRPNHQYAFIANAWRLFKILLKEA